MADDQEALSAGNLPRAGLDVKSMIAVRLPGRW